MHFSNVDIANPPSSQRGRTAKSTDDHPDHVRFELLADLQTRLNSALVPISTEIASRYTLLVPTARRTLARYVGRN